MQSKNLSHPVKAPNVAIMRFSRAEEQAQVHRAGCAHQHRADQVYPAVSAQDFLSGIFPDDYYYVAPCARSLTR